MSEIGPMTMKQLLPQMIDRQNMAQNITSEKSLSGELGASNQSSSSSQSFIDTLKNALGEVNNLNVQADKAAQDFATGQGANLHDVLIAMEKADVALRTVTALRNKMVEAYQEIMRMPV